MIRNDALKKICEPFLGDVKEIFGNDLVSVILYGSATTPEYLHRKSDINFLVVVTNKGMTRLQQVQSHYSKWEKRRIALPLFLTEDYINTSLDSFPIEFLNMQLEYELVDGRDVLDELVFDNNDLRLQCERELKGKLLQLRQGFIRTSGKAANLKALVSQSIVTFVSIFRALLVLKGLQVPESKAAVIRETCHAFEALNPELFATLLSIRMKEIKPDKNRMNALVAEYIENITGVSHAVDQMKL